MNFFKTLSSRNLNLLLAGLVVALAVMLGLAVWLTPAPKLMIEYDGATVEVFADKAWSLLPNDCLQIRWAFDGELPIHVDGREWHESGEQQFCPTIFATSPKVEMTDHRKGVYLGYNMDIKYLPAFLFDVVRLGGLGFSVFVTLFLLWDVGVKRSLPTRWGVYLILLLIICISSLKLAGIDIPLTIMLSLLRGVLLDPAWQNAGVLLSISVFTPLAVRILRRGIMRRCLQEFVPIFAFLLFVFLLYLPSGFQSIGHWETWYYRAYLDGLQSMSAANELVTRFWVMMPHRLALIVNTESYFGFHIVFLVISWFKLVFLYGVLRQLRFTLFQAFLITTIFLVYPVNSHLLSLRSIPNSFSVMCLLVSVFLILDFVKNPSRLHILGIWLSLTLNVVTQETAYLLILLIPLLWCTNIVPTDQKKLNLSAIWYMIPIYKIGYLALLLSSNRSFYRKGLFTSLTESESLLSNVQSVFSSLLEVYRHTFIDGWIQAFGLLDQGKWLPLTVVWLALIAVTSSWLSRAQLPVEYVCVRRMAISCLVGLLLVVPSVGILIWIEYYRHDLWRMYFYVPIAAAIVVYCLINLIVMPINRASIRYAAVVFLCICLVCPAFVRLLSQQERLVKSAGDKAFVLQQIVNSVPAFDPTAQVILWSMMSREELKVKHVHELSTKMLNSAIYVIYQDHRPQQAIFCIFGDDCYPKDGELLDFEFQFDTDYSNTVIFHLKEDLSVELLYRLPTEIGAENNTTYNVERLVDFAAPLPSRAVTMLGLPAR